MRLRALLFMITACLGLGLGAVAVCAQEVGAYAHVEAGALNLRAAPGAGAPVLRALPFGTSVSILERRGGWARVFVQGAPRESAEGWVAARFLRPGARAARRGGALAPLRVSMLDFDCRPALFGNSGIRKCVASVRVQLSRAEFDPARGDHVPIACRGAISYRTEGAAFSKRLIAVERKSIAHNDRLGQSVRVSFPVRSERDRIVSARLRAFTCWRD